MTELTVRERIVLAVALSALLLITVGLTFRAAYSLGRDSVKPTWTSPHCVDLHGDRYCNLPPLGTTQ